MLPYKVVNVSQNFDSTWHDTTYHPGEGDQFITASFTGTAVTVYHLIPNFVPSTTTLTNLSFSIDGVYNGQYIHIPDNTSNILYQVPVFTKPNLVNAPHTIEIRATGPNASILLFDYISYTSEATDSSSASVSSITSAMPSGSSLGTQTPPAPSATAIQSGNGSSHAGVGAVVGSVVGGIVGLVIIALLLYHYLHRHRRRASLRSVNAESADTTNRDPFGLPVLWSRRYRRQEKNSSWDSREAGIVASTPFAPPPPALGVAASITSDDIPLRPHAPPSNPSRSRPLAPTATRTTGDAPAAQSLTRIPTVRSDTASSARSGNTSLRAQVATLQAELVRLRDIEQEMHDMFVEPPPQYEED